MLPYVLLALAQVALLLIIAPFFAGLGRVLTAKLHSRRGPSILQEYRDLSKLMKRQDIWPAESGPVFRFAPQIMLAVMLTIITGIPVLMAVSPLGVMGDIIALIYLLAVPRFFFSLTSIDSGSPIAGVGGIRELIVGTLVEPTFMLALIVIALVFGTTSLGEISASMIGGGIADKPLAAVILAGCAFAFAAYVELGKLPYDLAEAEQEIQEGPLTEYSGPSLAYIKVSLALKQLILLSWALAIFCPWGMATSFAPVELILAVVIFLIKIVVAYCVVALIANTVSRVRYKLFARQSWVAFGIAALAFVFYIVGL